MPEPVPHIAFRCSTAAAIDRLCQRFQLFPNVQDWEIVVADPERIREFLDAYEKEPFDDDERFTLMALLIASFDDLLRENRDDPEAWHRLHAHLRRRFDLHGYTVQYWSLADQDELTEGFAITPRVQEVMGEVFGDRSRWPRD
ncbi:MAG: hypothetical protein QM813_06055 [Verrucomicrobiota bacterium]